MANASCVEGKPDYNYSVEGQKYNHPGTDIYRTEVRELKQPAVILKRIKELS